MILDQVGQFSHLTPDVHCGCGIGGLSTLEDCSQALIGLQLPRDASDHEGPCVKGFDVFWGPKPLRPQSYDSPPVHPDESHDNEANDVCDGHMYEENVAGDVPNSQNREVIVLLAVLEGVDDVDRDEGSAGEEGNASEDPTHHTQEPKVDSGVQANLVHKNRFFGMH